MNYIELATKFWRINEKTPLGTSAISLYLLLLEEYRKNEGKDFSISDNAISRKLSLTRPTIISVKSKLRNIGLIQYQTKNGLPCFYRMLSDFSFLQESTKQEPVKNNVGLSKKEAALISQVEEKPEAKSTIVEKQLEIVDTHTTLLKPVREEISIPPLEEFMAFAKTMEIYDESMDFQIKAKYESWVATGWKNGVGIPIIEWKNNLKNTLPHLKSSKKNLSINKIPIIKRPKTTYNE